MKCMTLSEVVEEGVSGEGRAMRKYAWHPFQPLSHSLSQVVKRGRVGSCISCNEVHDTSTTLTRSQVVEEGVSGELVVPTMTERLLGLLEAAQAAGTKYDWVSLFYLFSFSAGNA